MRCLKATSGFPVNSYAKDFEETIISGDSNSAGTIVGSSGYAPPEQFAGHSTYTNDLFSLGMVAIFLLTGKNPASFIDPSDGVTRWWSNISNWEWMNTHLLTTINKAISNAPNERFSTAKEMKRSLYNSKRGNCQVFTSHIYTPYMWKQQGTYRTELIKTEYEEAMEIQAVGSGAFERGKSWQVV